MKRDWLLALAIISVLAVGIVGFLTLLPPELVTIDHFVAYMSSLSTIIMVLIYILTTNRQLAVMSKQLKEMGFTRTLQTQPLPYVKPTESAILKHQSSIAVLLNGQSRFFQEFVSRPQLKTWGTEQR